MSPNSRRATSRRTRILPVVAPYRLDLTVTVLRRLSTNIVDRLGSDGTYTRAFEGLGAPGVVTVRQRDATALEVELDVPAGQAVRAFGLVERMLGVDRDLRSFDRRAAKISWLRALARRMRGVKPPRYPTLWEACVNAIIFQQISVVAAGSIMGRFVERFGTALRRGGEVLYAFPPPQAILEARDAALGETGLSANKFSTLRRVADALLGGTLDEAMLEERPSPAAALLLTAIKGIGPWTAAVILLRGLGRLDVFPAYDSGAARSLAALNPQVSAGEARGVPDLAQALETLGDQRGMLYYHLLLARLEARGEVSAQQPQARLRTARATRGGLWGDR